MASILMALIALVGSVAALIYTTRSYRETRRQEARTYRAVARTYRARTYRACAEMAELRRSHSEAAEYANKAAGMDSDADQIEQRYGRTHYNQVQEQQ